MIAGCVFAVGILDQIPVSNRETHTVESHRLCDAINADRIDYNRCNSMN